MKSLFAKSAVLLLVLTGSGCAPGRLGTVDLYLPEFTVTDDDQLYTSDTTTTAPTESDDTTEDYTWDYRADDNITDAPPTNEPLESLLAHIDLLAGQDGTTKGQYVYTDKTGRSVTVVYVAGPSSSLEAYASGE